MGRASVREAVASYLEAGEITFLNTIKKHPPKFTSEREFYDDDEPMQSSGAIIFIHIAAQKETRIALGGEHNGRKAREYEFVLDCYLRHLGSAVEAGENNDAFLDSLVAYIEANRTADSNGVIFQWGEGTFPGSADIEVDADFPRVLNGAGSVVQVYSSLRISVVEILET